MFSKNNFLFYSICGVCIGIIGLISLKLYHDSSANQVATPLETNGQPSINEEQGVESVNEPILNEEDVDLNKAVAPDTTEADISTDINLIDISTPAESVIPERTSFETFVTKLGECSAGTEFGDTDYGLYPNDKIDTDLTTQIVTMTISSGDQSACNLSISLEYQDYTRTTQLKEVSSCTLNMKGLAPKETKEFLSEVSAAAYANVYKSFLENFDSNKLSPAEKAFFTKYPSWSSTLANIEISTKYIDRVECNSDTISLESASSVQPTTTTPPPAENHDPYIRKSISNLRSQAELFYNGNDYTYSNLCESPRVIPVLNDLLNKIDGTPYNPAEHGVLNATQQATTAVCHSNSNSYIIATPLSAPGFYWCVDSTGVSIERQETVAAGELRCRE
jgi:hypothetical protein